MQTIYFTFRQISLLTLLLFTYTLAALSQTTFNSGSTGADGAFNPTANIDVQLPESGILNYTTINIPANVFVGFKKNSRNTPVTILASGDVRIAGQINVSGRATTGSFGVFGGASGPGGFSGGNGGNANGISTGVSGVAGDGPGGGEGGRIINIATDSHAGGASLFGGQSGTVSGSGIVAKTGMVYQKRALQPLIGGSGGGGGSAYDRSLGGGGGGGGGAILLASSGKIEFIPGWDGLGVYSTGGFGGDGGGRKWHPGGAGAGGAIRLIANTITGTPKIRVRGGGGGFPQFNQGGVGIIRVEANDLTQFSFGEVDGNSWSLGKPNPISLPNLPQIKITKVGGVVVPANAQGSHATPDISLPTSTPSSIAVEFSASNLPTGSTLTVTVMPEAGAPATVNSTPLIGSVASSTAAATVTLPEGQISIISASATIDVLLAMGNQPLYINGERIKRVEIAAAIGGAQQVTYISENGHRLKWPE